MPLISKHVLHHRALCDGCRAVSDYVCGDDMGQVGRPLAIRELRLRGWVHRVPGNERERNRGWCEEQGAGEWYCPRCPRREGDA